MTRDQLYIMLLPEATLKGLCGVQTMSIHSAIKKGIIKDDKEHLGGYRSLAEKLNAEAREAKKKDQSKKVSRAKRRELQAREKQRKDG